MNKKGEFRVERDQLGEMQIPATAYWGIKTARSWEAFPLSGLKPHNKLVEASVLVKKAAALANADSGRLDTHISRAIAQAADEVLNGQWHDHFIVHPFQSGAGIAHNHNVNEVLANRGSEILGGITGTYTTIHPEDHVNLSQSAHDTYPTAMRLAILLSLKDFEPVLLDLERLLRRKSLEFDKIVKVGRTYLKDTAPVTLGQEFNAYGASIEHSYRRIREASQSLLEMNIGASAVGTGINASPEYITKVHERLQTLSGLRLKPVEDFFRLSQSLADFVEFSSSLKELSIELTKIANDLQLLNSGPKAGFAELTLPTIQIEPSIILPGILPDQTNPTMAECVSMVAFQVIGNDLAITLAAQSGQLELNIMMPMVIHNILSSMDLLKNVVLAFNQRCIAGISANTARCRELLEASNLMAGALVEHLGVKQLTALIEESRTTGKTLRDLVIGQDLMTQELWDKTLQQKSLTRPGILTTVSLSPQDESSDSTQ